MAEITWIKLKTDMFNSTKIRLIEKLPEGDTILIIWIKLLTAAGKANCNGYIMLTENIPMNVEEMAVIFDRPLNTVRLALEAFKRYGMIEMDENETVRISNWEKHQNIDGMEHIKKLNAERNRKYRERKKQQQLEVPKDDSSSDVSVTSPITSHDGTDLDLDLDKDLDKEKDKDLDNKQSSSVPLQHPSFNQIKTAFEQTIRVATVQDCKHINEALDYYEPQLILQALEAGKNGRTFRYVLGILDNWRREFNVKTYQDWVNKIDSKGGAAGGSSKQSNGTSVSRTTEEMEMLERLSNYNSPGYD